jgi:Trypsin
MNERVAEIKLPVSGSTTAAGTTAVVSGWGKIRVSSTKFTFYILTKLLKQSNGLLLPLRLQSASVSVYDPQQCKDNYGELNMTITDKMLCAGGNGRQDSCQVFLQNINNTVCTDIFLYRGTREVHWLLMEY